MPTAHPECTETERFLGNSEDSIPCAHTQELKALLTLRFGKVAFDINGKKLASSYRPIFIDASEYQRYDEIRTAEFRLLRGY